MYGRVESFVQEAMAENVPNRKRMSGCTCHKQRCSHVRMYLGTKTPEPYEEDFLFASEAMVDRLEACSLVECIDSSDHAPVRATFGL